MLDQVRAGELVEQFVGTVERRAGEGGHRVCLDLRTGMTAEQSEGAGGVGGQVLVGPGEDGAYGGPGVAPGVQQPQPPPLVAQLVDQVGQRDQVTAGGQRRRHPQRQRELGAQPGQRHGRCGLGVRPGSDQLVQQRYRVGQRQRVQHQPAGAVQSDQPG
ncbi:hypothetical protein [Micromonospora echinospora]|uniref:hypothetical protein n=1 Tax=Micromonospora echinospora TaxID=1877 RepID=UPI001E41DDFB|nr:hypothetical protein [Micromonospora echinospora]